MAETYTKIGDLRPYSRGVNVRCKILEMGEVRTVISRRDGSEHRASDALIGDDSGCIKLTLWDDAIDDISVGDVIDIKNGYANTFRGSMRFNIGFYGTYEKSSESITNVNLENNLSEKVVSERYGSSRGRYGQSYRGSRRMYSVVCSDCGKETEVPFKPITGRPVYCRDCYQKHRRY